MKFLAYSFCALAAGVMMSSGAQAQVQLPQFSISDIPTIEMEQTAPLDNEAAFAGIMNPLMRDTLRLQYQINLLERLIRRQTEIQRIAESYSKIGLPFKQPAPPETACMQLPVNMLCMAFYPESEKYEDLIADRRQEFSRDQARRMETMMADININDLVEQDTQTPTGQPRRQRQNTPDTVYNWEDIRCLAGKCSALLVNREEADLRFRLREGDDLPTGGTVSSISVGGVAVSMDGENYNLRAANVGPRTRETNAVADNDISNILNENLDDEAMQNVQTGDDQAIPAQTVVGGNLDAVPDALGATGLF